MTTLIACDTKWSLPIVLGLTRIASLFQEQLHNIMMSMNARDIHRRLPTIHGLIRIASMVQHQLHGFKMPMFACATQRSYPIIHRLNSQSHPFSGATARRQDVLGRMRLKAGSFLDKPVWLKIGLVKMVRV